MAQSSFEETEIDLIDLMWRFIEQWRGLLVAGVVCSLILSTGMYVKSYIHRNDVVVVDQTVEEDAAPATTPAPIDPSKEYSAICSALYSYTDYMTKKLSYDNAITSQVDFSKGVKVTYIFEYEANSSGDLLLLNDAYNNIVYDESFLNSLKNELSEEASITSIGSLVDADVVSNINVPSGRNGMLSVCVQLPASTNLDSFEDVVVTSVNTYHLILNQKVGNHSIRFVSGESIPLDSAQLASEENSREYDVVSARNAYRNAIDALSSDGQNFTKRIVTKCSPSIKYMDYINCLDDNWEQYLASISKDAAAEAVPEAVPAVTPAAVPQFSKKYVVLGFVMGIFLYMCAYMVYFIFHRVVRNEEDLNAATGIRNFGGIYEYPYKSKIARFLFDRRIYEFRKRKARSMDAISDDLVSKLAYNKKDCVTLITLGDSCERVRQIKSEQVDYLKSKGILTNEISVTRRVEDMADSEFAQASDAFIIMEGNRTKVSSLASLYAKLEEYKVSIIGSEYIEV